MQNPGNFLRVFLVQKILFTNFKLLTNPFLRSIFSDMENPFAERMAKLPDRELFKVLKLKEEYQELAVEAAKHEIEKRNLTKEKSIELLQEIENEEKKERKKNRAIREVFSKIAELIKNYFIPLPGNKKTPAPYINSLAVFLIAGIIIQFLIPLYFDLLLGYYSDALIMFSIALFGITIVISLVRKKKFGWIMLNILLIFSLSENCLLFYRDWFIYAPPEKFRNFFGLIYYVGLMIIIPFLIVRYLNNTNVMDYFRISTITRKLTLIISIILAVAYFISWAVIFPEYL